LYQHAVTDLDEQSIARINVSRAADGFTLSRENDVWTVTVDGQSAAADAEAADDLAMAVADFQIAEINFGQADLPAEAQTTVQVIMNDGSEHVLRFGAEHEGKYPVAISGKTQTFMAESLDVQEIAPPSASLKQVAETPEEPAETEITPAPDASTDAAQTEVAPEETPPAASDATAEEAMPEAVAPAPGPPAEAGGGTTEAPVAVTPPAAEDATGAEAMPEAAAPAPEPPAQADGGTTETPDAVSPPSESAQPEAETPADGGTAPEVPADPPAAEATS
jgi:hypothetical protein